MKIGIISDIHDNLVNLEKFLFWAENNNLKKLIFCGDLTNSETLNKLATGFVGDIFIAKGNAEIYKKDEIKHFDNIIYGDKFSVFEVEGKRFGLVHELYWADKILKKEKVNNIFYGHTHKPWTYQEKGIKMLNPGPLGGMFCRATFAVWDTKEDEFYLKVLDKI